MIPKRFISMQQSMRCRPVWLAASTCDVLPQRECSAGEKSDLLVFISWPWQQPPQGWIPTHGMTQQGSDRHHDDDDRAPAMSARGSQRTDRVMHKAQTGGAMLPGPPLLRRLSERHVC